MLLILALHAKKEVTKAISVYGEVYLEMEWWLAATHLRKATRTALKVWETNARQPLLRLALTFMTTVQEHLRKISVGRVF